MPKKAPWKLKAEARAKMTKRTVKAAKAAKKVRSSIFPIAAAVKKVTEATLAQERAARRRAKIKPITTGEM